MALPDSHRHSRFQRESVRKHQDRGHPDWKQVAKRLHQAPPLHAGLEQNYKGSLQDVTITNDCSTQKKNILELNSRLIISLHVKLIFSGKWSEFLEYITECSLWYHRKVLFNGQRGNSSQQLLWYNQ